MGDISGDQAVLILIILLFGQKQIVPLPLLCKIKLKFKCIQVK